MQPPSPNAGHDTPITPRLALHTSGAWNATAHIAPPTATLGGPSSAPSSPPLPLDVFVPAEPPVTLAVRRAPPAVLGAPAQSAALALHYTPVENATYALLQEVRTADGVVYDFTLPQRIGPPSAAVLGGEAPASTLTFPISPLILGSTPSATLGFGSDVISSVAGDVVINRVLHVIKSPIDRALRSTITQFEPAARMLVQRDTLVPLEGFEAWRALLPPDKPHRVLLCIHGFGSNAANSGFAALASQFAAGYDAVLCYEHPTISKTPLENARDLLDRIPNDLALSVDIIAHSRGGLVARSLIELAEPSEKFVPQRLISHGTPHDGTRLADPERWDRLLSIGMTAATWLASAAGATIWIPKALELVLKAAAQSVFELPGIQAMRKNSSFLQDLNAVADSSTIIGALQRRVHYAAVSSSFSMFGAAPINVAQAVQAMAAQAFINEANDLIVPTGSMNAIDKTGGTLAPDRQFKASVNHFSYFRDVQVLEFLHSQLRA